MKTKQREQRVQTSPESGLVYWISLSEAERRFEVTREQVIARIRDGRFEARRTLCDGDLVVAVSSKELEAEFSLRPAGSLPLPAQTDDATILDEVREELQAERVARARLEGELASSDRVERSAQRYADRLERELEESRKQAMTLARALGRAEKLAAASTKQLAAPARRSWWKPWA